MLINSDWLIIVPRLRIVYIKTLSPGGNQLDLRGAANQHRPSRVARGPSKTVATMPKAIKLISPGSTHACTFICVGRSNFLK
jgi:hypothetical protein